MKTNNKKPKSLIKQALTWLLGLVLTLALLTGGIFLWAYLSTGTSLVARGIMWGDSDWWDLYRFPTRSMQASMAPVQFEGGTDDALWQLPVTAESIQPEEMPFATFLKQTNTTAFIVLHGNRLLYPSTGYWKKQPVPMNGCSHVGQSTHGPMIEIVPTE